MALSRYSRTININLGTMLGTSYVIPILRDNIKNGNIRYQEIVMQEKDRLDNISAQFYGDSTLFWIIAAVSNIGWGLQVPAGTMLKIPLLEDVQRFT